MNIVGEVLIRVYSPEGGAQPRSQTSRECTSMGTSPYIKNSLFISLLLSCFTEKKYFHGNIKTYKIRGVPLA
jgi:hypothetical protein